MGEGCAVWLYAVIRDDLRERLPSARGVAGERVRALVEGNLAAVVGSVGQRDFAAEQLARNLEDLDWLAGAARAHDAVVAAAAACGPVVPVRLATIFGHDDAVRGLLAARRDEFRATLDALAGRSEWGVKAYLDPDESVNAGNARSGPALSPGAAECAPGGTGSAYLLRRRAELAARRSAETSAREWARQMHDRLRGVSTASRLLRAQDPKLSGHKASMVLNAAYLVDEDRVERFRAVVEELIGWQPGLDVELTGPWPPYSFAVSAGARDG